MDIKEHGVAIVTGGDGDMGQVIVESCVQNGYRTILTCRSKESGLAVQERLLTIYPHADLQVVVLELTNLHEILDFVDRLKMQGEKIAILVNNAGVLCKKFERTEGEGIEQSVAVNYLAPYLLTRLLLTLMQEGSRIVNTVSITYKIGQIKDDFFVGNEKKSRIPRYANSKLGLLLFTLELAEKLRNSGIFVNAADPGIVSTKMIRLDKWFDFLTDIFYRPFIKTPEQGASTAIKLALSEEIVGITGQCYADQKQCKLSDSIKNHPRKEWLWRETDKRLISILKRNVFDE